MSKFDITYTTLYMMKYIKRIDAKDKEQAKKKLLREEKDIDKIISIKDAEDYILFNFVSLKDTQGTQSLHRQYYTGYLSLPMFGYAAMFDSKKQKAKRFMLKSDAKEEMKKIGRKISDFKIDTISAD